MVFGKDEGNDSLQAGKGVYCRLRRKGQACRSRGTSGRRVFSAACQGFAAYSARSRTVNECIQSISPQAYLGMVRVMESRVLPLRFRRCQSPWVGTSTPRAAPPPHRTARVAGARMGTGKLKGKGRYVPYAQLYLPKSLRVVAAFGADDNVLLLVCTHIHRLVPLVPGRAAAPPGIFEEVVAREDVVRGAELGEEDGEVEGV